MTELACADPCVLFALGRESGPFCRAFRPHQRFCGAPCRARFCGPAGQSVLVLETGMGTANTERALAWLLAGPRLDTVVYRPQFVVSAGFAGALCKAYRVGDVVVATEVADMQGGLWPGTLAAKAGEPLRRGRLLTVAHMVADSAEKRALGERYGAVAVDMETATVARACSRAGVPFGSVRAISDDVDTTLSPRLAALFAAGRVSPLRVLGQVLRAPTLIGELWRLARQTRVAARQLAKALGELLAQPRSRKQ